MSDGDVEKKLEVIKHSAAIQISSNITLLQRRAWNVLLGHAYDELPTQATHSIRVAELMRRLEFDSKNEEYLKDALRALVGCIVEWHILNKDGDVEWVVAGLLAGARIVRGMCMYSYEPMLRERLHNPNMYARINLSMQNRFESKHAQALWELCTDYLGAGRNVGETAYIGLDRFRKLMGIAKDMYPAFMRFNGKVVKPAVAEINRVSDFRVEVEYLREKRKVTALKFRIRRIKVLPTADDEQHDLFPDPADIPLAVELLHNAGLVLQEAFVDADKRPTVEGDTNAIFTRYVREKIHLLEARKKQGKASNPTGFLLTALKTNYSNADFEREEAAKVSAEKVKELKKLKDDMDTIKRGASDAVEALMHEMIDATPSLLDEAVEAAKRDNDITLRYCYKADKTPLQNLQASPAIVGIVIKYLERKFPDQYIKKRATFLRQQAEAETRINALEAEGIRV